MCQYNVLHLFPHRIDLGTVLDGLMEKVDFKTAPTSNQINICRDYTGNVHNLMKSSLQAFGRRRFNPEAKLDIVFVDKDEKTEGAVDGGGPTREYLRLLMKAIQQSCIFEGPECEKRLTLDTLGKYCVCVICRYLLLHYCLVEYSIVICIPMKYFFHSPVSICIGVLAYHKP